MSSFRLTLTVDADLDPIELGTFDTPAAAMEAARDDRTRLEHWDDAHTLPEGEWELYQRMEDEPRSWTKWLRPEGPQTEAYYTVKERWEEE